MVLFSGEVDMGRGLPCLPELERKELFIVQTHKTSVNHVDINQKSNSGPSCIGAFRGGGKIFAPVDSFPNEVLDRREENR